MVYFKIIDLIFLINYDAYDNVDNIAFVKKHLNEHFLKFICEPQNPDYILDISYEKEYAEDGEFLVAVPFYSVYKTNDTIKYKFIQRENPDKEFQCIYLLNMSMNNNKSEIIVFSKYFNEEEKAIKIHYILRQYFEYILIKNNAFILHSVALQYKDKGLAFTASSGVGKTTHTTFWENKFNAEILNGDSPFIKIINDKPYIYGSPWCGTSGITKNKKLQLHTIIVIKQSSSNKMKRMSKIEAVNSIIGQIRRPLWDENTINMCLDYVEFLVNHINIYELECLPNEEAADVALAGIAEIHE